MASPCTKKRLPIIFVFSLAISNISLLKSSPVTRPAEIRLARAIARSPVPQQTSKALSVGLI